MKNPSIIHHLFFVGLVFLTTACDKGYQVRFTNYNTEPMDSVVVGANTIVFTNIGLEAQSDYVHVKKGNYNVVCISKTKKKFYSSLSIPNHGSGKRSIQIDAINSISILED